MQKYTQISVYIRRFQYAILGLLTAVVLFIPGQNMYTSAPMVLNAQTSIEIPVPTPYPYPINSTGVLLGGDITAEGIVIRDMDSGALLYSRNADQLLSPASTTKLMTALVALDVYSLRDIVVIGATVTEGQMMGLLPGERISVENLLYGALIQSGNDAAFALAAHYQGGVDGFVSRMNQKARDLGMNNSNFTNPIGYDDVSHKMSPMDLMRLSIAAMHNQTIAKIVGIPSITISDETHTHFHALKNVNQLLGKIPGVAGIKTGWTEEAGENLVTLVDRDGHRTVFVVLRSANRFDETVRLIDWVYTNFEWQNYAPILSTED